MPTGITIFDKVFIGEFTDIVNRTGVSVLYFEDGAIAGVYKYGFATSTRQIDSLEAGHIVSKIDAITLTGGSAFGLDASSGVMQWLKEKNKGTDIRGITIPIVPSAALFDLRFSTGMTPDFNMGYSACNALSKEVHEGSYGAGTGATVGKILGVDNSMKGGAGTLHETLSDGSTIAVYVVVNAFGDVLGYERNIIAGARKERYSHEFINTSNFLMGGGLSEPVNPVTESTNLCVVITDAEFDKTTLINIARMAASGITKAISPAGTSFDGDIVFAVSVGNKRALIDVVGYAASVLIEEAIKRAVRNADGFGLVPRYSDFLKGH